MRGHGPNLGRVREAAASWRADTIVSDIWCRHVSTATLEDPDLLGLFLSGSYTDWVEARRQPAWQEQLDAVCQVIRTAHAPMLAVCGSHQLVGYAFGGWKAVSHMAAGGQAAATIAEETDGVTRAPNPRIGEVGTFHYRRERADPLFAGLTDRPDEPLIFSQWHYDQVVASPLPPGAISLLRPDGLKCAAQNGGIASLGDVTVVPGRPPVPFVHRGLESDAECCRAQALRYDVPPAGRLLYTTQFHPDLAGKDSEGNADHGIGLLHSFFGLAEAYWKG